MNLKKILIEILRKFTYVIGSSNFVSDSSRSIASGSDWHDTSCVIEFEPGSYIITEYASFGANTAGVRAMRIYSNTSDVSVGASQIQQTAITASGWGVMMSGTVLITVDSPRKYTLQVRQTSGSTLTVTTYLRALRLK